jgi:hypothetical protein
MPDDDRFERQLRGRGWRSAYRLAASECATPLLVDSLIKAAAHALRNQAQSPSLSNVVDVLQEALGSPPLLNRSNSSDGLGAFEHLANGLDQIEVQDRGHVGTQIAVRAAEKVFVEQARQNQIHSKEQIRDRLGEVFIADLIDHQCFSRVRNGIAEKKGRTAEQQHAWEQELREEIKPQARKLFRSAAEAGDNREVRAPKGIASPPAPLETQLHEPLIPLQR